MEEILKAILQGAMQQSGGQRQTGQSADIIGDLIKGVVGGQSPLPQTAPAPSGRSGAAAGGVDLNDIIGILIGGSQRSGVAQSGGIADILGAILGGGNAAGANGVVGGTRGVDPISQILSQKLGISPVIAQAIVTFFVGKFLLPKLQGVLQGSKKGVQGSSQDDQGDTTVDLDELLDQVDNPAALQTKFSNNGMAQELAQYTGIDEQQANIALQELVKIVGDQRSTLKPTNPKETDLKELLDTW